MTGQQAQTRRLALNADTREVAFAASIAEGKKQTAHLRYCEWEAGTGTLTEEEARRVESVLAWMEERTEEREGTRFGRRRGYQATVRSLGRAREGRRLG